MAADELSIAPPFLRGALKWATEGMVTQWNSLSGPSLLTQDQFQSELVLLGLSGARFGSRDYADALGRYLNLSISVRVVPDTQHPAVARRLALSGRLAELRLCERGDGHEALILVPESLPPLVFALTVLHELGHLASGDHLIDPRFAALSGSDQSGAIGVAKVRSGKRLARRPPLVAEKLREEEADLRASYALVAGCLGAEHPCAHRMYDIL